MYCFKAHSVVIHLTKFDDPTLSRFCVIRPSCFLQNGGLLPTGSSRQVISGQRASGIEVVPLTKFGDPSSNRLATIQNAADGHARKKSPSYALRNACTASVG